MFVDTAGTMFEETKRGIGETRLTDAQKNSIIELAQAVPRDCLLLGSIVGCNRPSSQVLCDWGRTRPPATISQKDLDVCPVSRGYARI